MAAYLTPDQLDAIRVAVAIRSKALEIHPSHVWPAIRQHFGVRTYYRLTQDQFGEAISFIKTFKPGADVPKWTALLANQVSAVVTAQLESQSAPKRPRGRPRKCESAPAAAETKAPAPVYASDPNYQPGKGAKTLDECRAQVYRLQLRIEMLSDTLLGVLDDIERITGVSPIGIR